RAGKQRRLVGGCHAAFGDGVGNASDDDVSGIALGLPVVGPAAVGLIGAEEIAIETVEGAAIVVFVGEMDLAAVPGRAPGRAELFLIVVVANSVAAEDLTAIDETAWYQVHDAGHGVRAVNRRRTIGENLDPFQAE